MPGSRVDGWLSCAGAIWSPEANKVFETAYFAAEACNADWASVLPALLAQVNKEQARSGFPRVSEQQLKQKRGNFRHLVVNNPRAAAVVKARVLSFPVDDDAGGVNGADGSGADEQEDEGEEDGKGKDGKGKDAG